MDGARFDALTRLLRKSVNRRQAGALTALTSLVVVAVGRVSISQVAEVEAAACGNRQKFGRECWPDSEEVRFLELINDFRRRNGKRELAMNDQLGKAAELHSQFQAKRRKMTHDGPKKRRTVKQRLNKAGYTNASAWGENVLWHSANGEAGHAFRGWEKSPPHRKNMLSNNYTEIGIARSRARNGAWYWTTDFGDRTQ